jgi:hypothetical protein
MQPDACPFAVPRDATRFSKLATLAGDYDLIEISSQPAPRLLMHARLHLEVPPPDSAPAAPSRLWSRRAELTGWLDPAGTVEEGRGPIAVDTARANVSGRGAELFITNAEGPGETGLEVLTITAVSSRGFWGHWDSDAGIVVEVDSRTGLVLPPRLGFFCARRRGGS